MSVVEYPSNEHPKKKRYLSPLDNDNMTCVRREIADIKESLAEIGLVLRLEFADIRESLTDIRESLAEIADLDIKESLAELASEAREDRQNIINTLEDLDIARIEEMTYEAREERDNIYYMLKEILAEIQQRK
jgi:hypothetical protein